MKTYRSSSSARTKEIGSHIGKALLAKREKAARDKLGPGLAAKAAVIALYGDLGAGKTTFTQGLLKALGDRGRVISHTFVLMKKFRLAGGQLFSHAYHIDAYRFRGAEEAGALGLHEILTDPQAIVIVEWPERLAGLLPRTAVPIRFLHGKSEQERIIKGL